MPAKKKPNTRKSNTPKPKDRRNKARKDATPAASLVSDVERRKAIAMRLDGYTFREIADELNVSVSTAHDYVNDGWERINNATDEDRAKLRDLELTRLDQMLKRAMPLAIKNNLMVINVEFGPDGPVEVRGEDAELQFKAMDRVLKIGKRRADLLGLDAPTKIEADMKSNLVPLDELKRRVEAAKAKKGK